MSEDWWPFNVESTWRRRRWRSEKIQDRRRWTTKEEEDEFPASNMESYWWQVCIVWQPLTTAQVHEETVWWTNEGELVTNVLNMFVIWASIEKYVKQLWIISLPAKLQSHIAPPIESPVRESLIAFPVVDVRTCLFLTMVSKSRASHFHLGSFWEISLGVLWAPASSLLRLCLFHPASLRVPAQSIAPCACESTLPFETHPTPTWAPRSLLAISPSVWLKPNWLRPSERPEKCKWI